MRGDCELFTMRRRSLCMETRLQEVASKIALLEKQLTEHFLTRQFNTSLFLKSKRVVDVSSELRLWKITREIRFFVSERNLDLFKGKNTYAFCAYSNMKLTWRRIDKDLYILLAITYKYSSSSIFAQIMKVFCKREIFKYETTQQSSDQSERLTLIYGLNREICSI